MSARLLAIGCWPVAAQRVMRGHKAALGPGRPPPRLWSVGSGPEPADGEHAAVDYFVYCSYPQRVSDTTTIRVTRAARDAFNNLAAKRGESLIDTVSRAARLLEQETIGRDLSAPLRDDELAWLDADVG